MSLEAFVRDKRRLLIRGETGHVLSDAHRDVESICWKAISDNEVLGIH